jgi:hypothetical protein
MVGNHTFGSVRGRRVTGVPAARAELKVPMYPQKKLFTLLIVAFLLLGVGCQEQVSTEDFEHLRASIMYVQASFEEEEQHRDTSAPIGTMPEESFQSIVELRRLALEEAEQIDPEALAKMDSDMPQRFKTQYLRGLQQWNDGVKTEDYALANRGLLLLNDWGRYYQGVLESL